MTSPSAKPPAPSEPTVTRAPTQILAIDWSGAASPAAQRRGIQVATCQLSEHPPHAPVTPLAGGRLTGSAVHKSALTHPALPEQTQLTGDRLRSQVEAHLLALANTPTVAGLDFSFSYPAWFLKELACTTAPKFWTRVALDGEQWLSSPHPHFWGRRKGSGPPPSHRAPLWRGYRVCEQALFATPGRLPSSSFQIGGAGAVGTGSLRGIPMLARLRAAGWSVWPFDPPRLPLLVEIYPRLLTGPVVKSSAAARAAYLSQPRFGALPTAVQAQARASEDAFDALISALAMRDNAAQFAQLRQAQDPLTRLEGAIWQPNL